jgi:hypothetical protein
MLVRADLQGDSPSMAVGFGADDEGARRRTIAYFCCPQKDLPESPDGE